METFKQLMSFPMFAAAVWLITVYAKIAGKDALAYFLYGLVILAMAAWVFGRYNLPHKAVKTRWIARVASLLLVGTFVYLTQTGYTNSKEAEALLASGPKTAADGKIVKHGIVWDPINTVEVIQHRKKKRTVFIDFTADW